MVLRLSEELSEALLSNVGVIIVETSDDQEIEISELKVPMSLVLWSNRRTWLEMAGTFLCRNAENEARSTVAIAAKASASKRVRLNWSSLSRESFSSAELEPAKSYRWQKPYLIIAINLTSA